MYQVAHIHKFIQFYHNSVRHHLVCTGVAGDVAGIKYTVHGFMTHKAEARNLGPSDLKNQVLTILFPPQEPGSHQQKNISIFYLRRK